MYDIAVIIVTYNNLQETTKPCLASIFSAKTTTNFCVVVVDNKSNDDTVKYIANLYATEPRLLLVPSQSNLGFAGGNNIGIKSVKAGIYVLLNSDTLVTDYWLDRFLHFFNSHPEVGMAGPVSNFVGTDQMVDTSSPIVEEILQQGMDWATRCSGDYYYTNMLSFFCVAIRGDVLSEVGFLDESFGMGMFEDDDYCVRTLKNGYKLACIEDLFIYHKGSGSFNNVPNKIVKELFENNKSLYESKHGKKWTPRLNVNSFIALCLKYTEIHEMDVEKKCFKLSNKLKIMSKLYSETGSAQDNTHVDAILNSLSWKIISKINNVIDNSPLRSLGRWASKRFG